MNCRYPRPDASIRMFCFPWAGGGASFYTALGKDVRDDIEVLALCLPGRESRFQEPCRANLKDTLDEIIDVVCKNYFDKPFIFFGHSMGALLAFLLALELKRLHGKEPIHMYLSGSSAPQSPTRKAVISNVKHLNEDEFCDRLISMGGIPNEIQENRELLNMFVPPIRADYNIIAQIQYEMDQEEKPPLSCSIDFFDGESDTDHNVHEWQALTTGIFKLQKFPGGHFYIKDPVNIKQIINHINQQYSQPWGSL